MKCEVQLYVAGTVIREVVQCRNYDHAKEIALARNPGCKIISVTAIFT